jgi:hypothetical protein
MVLATRRAKFLFETQQISNQQSFGHKVAKVFHRADSFVVCGDELVPKVKGIAFY